MVYLSNSSVNSSLSALEEESLLHQLTQGDRDAFWELWIRHRDYLACRCRVWMGGNSVDGEEALSLTMLKAWEKLPAHAAKITNVKAWLTRMTHNLCVDLHRKRKRNITGIDNFEEIAGQGSGIAVSSYSPESLMLNNELEMIIHQRINDLSPRLRHPFILRFHQNLSYPEIAQKLKISKQNVYKRIQEARQFLQQSLQRYLLGLQLPDSIFAEATSATEVTLVPTKSRERSPFVIATMTESNIEQINYQVTALCLD